MTQRGGNANRGWPRILSLLVLSALVLGVLVVPNGSEPVAVAAQKRRAKKRTPPKPKLPPLKTSEDKLRLLGAIRRTMPALRKDTNFHYSPADLDQKLELGIGLHSGRYAEIVDDQTFIRRVTLDLTGRLPSPDEVRRFSADTSLGKRDALVDELLETEDYARRWAYYWRTVIFYNSAANQNRVNPQALEDWLAEQFQRNAPWDYITAELISADGADKDHGPDNFLLACEKKPEQLAAETARIFMGINIQCAECHDHPFDSWKREQFHEMAAFFSPGKYYMTGQVDPDEKTLIQAKFLLGEQPPEGLNANARRVAVAAYLIYNKDNYWYARAFVNRVWNELMGDGFYAVDSLGPDNEVLHKYVINRLAFAFRYNNFDVKWLMQLITKTKAYQRQIRTIQSDEELFTATRPTRLRPDQVAGAVADVLGEHEPLRNAVERTFRVDPSVPQRDLEGSIQQVLLLMNHPVLNREIRNGPLKKRLVAMKDNAAMVEELYLAVLARTPTPHETTRSLEHLRKVPNRAEAVEDLLWVLLNSSEFLTKR